MRCTRRRIIAICAVVLLAAMRQAIAAGLQPSPRTAGTTRVVELHIDREIEPVMAEYIGDGIDAANRDNAALILITMDTPGGLDTSMRSIIQHIIESNSPVAVYVTPSGSRAASAGFFILLSADIAAMAPATHTGAASPIAAIGGYPVAIDQTMAKKIVNDATAYLRSYAARRGRNVALAETAITEAKAFTEKEALDGKLCDLIAPTREDLVAQLDGRVISRFDGRSTRLALGRPEIVDVQMSGRQRFLARIVEPDVFFILVLVAVIGIYTESTHPGLVAPGVIGAVALLLALFAMHLLPVNLAGLLLIVLALALFILEAKYTSHGVLGLGGIVAMLLGAVMLVRSPLTGGGVSLGAAVGATLPFAAITIVLMRLVLRSRAWQPQTGIEELIREVGTVTSMIGGSSGGSTHGMVRIHGELWQATSAGPIAAGTRVRVLRVQGLTLQVEPIEAASRHESATGQGDDRR